MPSGRYFDAIVKQRFLNEDTFGLRSEIAAVDKAERDCKMLWSYARLGYTDVVLALICMADQELTNLASQSLVSLANMSLDLEEWRAYTQIIPEEDFYKYGHRHRIDHPDRTEAFIASNLVLLHDHWLRTGTIDRARVDRMFAQPMDKPAVQGVMEEHEIMPLSAWPEIAALRDLPDPGGNKRPNSAARRIGQMLAEDPAQLHDAKSPVRKKARAYMRQSMSPRWLAGGLAVQAMNWLQTFEWREGESGLSPREVMLRAYAYMPDVEPPPNIAVEVERLRKLPV